MPIGALPDGRTPVVLSAHDEDLVAVDAAALLRYVERRPGVAAVADRVLRTRRIRRHRVVIRAADLDELRSGLRAVAASADHPLVARSSATVSSRTAFVFPGQGNQWPGMGADAYRLLPRYRAEADRCDAAVAAAGWPSPVAYLAGSPDNKLGNWHEVQIQGAQFTHAVALARVWQASGVWPDLTVGHSLGEIAAAHIAGAITLTDAVEVLIARAATVGALAGSYANAVVQVDAESAAELARSSPGWLEVSVVNSPSSTAVAGDADSVAALVNRLTGQGIFARHITIGFPTHTSVLEPLRDAFVRRLPDAVFTAAPVEFVGAARGAVVPAGTGFAEYWYENLRNTVRFDRAVRAATARGAGTFVEMSPHPALLMPMAELTEGADPLLLSSSRRDEPLLDHLAAGIATAAVADPAFRWADVVPTYDGPPLRGFPNAPMRREHLWAHTTRPRSQPAVPPRVAVERWQPHGTPPGRQHVTLAVTAAIGADQRVVRRLGDAVANHQRAQPATPAEADVVVVVAPAVDTYDPVVAAHELTRLVGDGLLKYPAPAVRARALWLVTAGGEQVSAGDAPSAPGQAAIAAMHRSVGFEHPDIAFAHLDLPRWVIDDAMAAQAVDALLDEPGEVALRAGVRHVRALAFAELPRKSLLDNIFDNVIITGGAGAVGLRLARRCAELGARRIVLLGRGGAESAAVDALRLPGVDIVAVPCDITDPDAIARTSSAAGGDASLLIHAAGTAVLAPAGRLTADDMRNTLAAKVTGLDMLLRHWPRRRDCRVVLCSSASSVWGGQGHAAYSAANRMLDAMAQRLRADGHDAVSVRSGLWQGSGILDQAESARVERSGLTAMAPGAAADLVLRGHDTDPLIFAADLDRLRLLFDAHSVRAEFTARTADLHDEQPDRSAQDIVRDEIAATLDLGSTAVDLAAALIDIGVDSLLALDLRKRLRRATGRSVPLATLLGGISGAELAAVIDPAAPFEHGRSAVE